MRSGSRRRRETKLGGRPHYQILQQPQTASRSQRRTYSVPNHRLSLITSNALGASQCL